jgi:hypothetical protein
MLRNTGRIQKQVKKSAVNSLAQACLKIERPLAYVILFVAGMFSAFGTMPLPMALAALTGLGLIILRVLFAIESKQAERHDIEEFTDFQSAAINISDTIQQALAQKNTIEIKWVGTTMGRGAPFLMHHINQFIQNKPNSKILLEVFMLSPDYSELSSFNMMWPDQAKNNYQLLNTWISDCDSNKLEGVIYKYSFPPMHIGLLIDNRVLYMAFGSWEENVIRTPLQGNQTNYEYCVGMNPHYRYESRTPKGAEYIRQYLAWTNYLKFIAQKPTPQNP